MAFQLATTQKALVGGFDIAQIKAFSVGSLGREEKDAAVFGDTTAVKGKGLRLSSFGLSGLHDTSDLGHDSLFDTADAEAIIGASFLAQANAVGEIGYFANVNSTATDLPFTHNEYYQFVWSATPAGPLVRGTIALSAATATATSASYQLGAIVAKQAMYCMVHVIAAAGATVDVLIRSDSASNMAGATNRITVPQITAIGASGLLKFTTVGADDWWDADLTVTGTATVYVLFGLARETDII